MIPVNISHVSFSNMGFVVFLKGAADQRSLPIFIGAPEAQAIAFFLEKVKVPRPLTHDLFKSVLDNLECRLKRVEICGLRDNTFFALIYLERDGIESAIDARPSDAIALALRSSAPIGVAEEVMETAGVVLTNENGATGKPGDKPHLSPRADLQQRIAKAVEEERYEDAARLRDELKKMPHSN